MTYELDLSGHKALVTGGGQGVGRGIAHAFASAGAAVVVNDFVTERAAAVVDELTALGATATAAPFDVSDYEAVLRAVGDSGIDIIANNAGNAGPEGFNFGPFAESEPADWNRYFAVNLFGVMNCTRAVLPGMISQGWGRVVTIVSDAGRWGEPGMAGYSAAKAGAAGFTRSLARDVGRHGITVNNIALASIDSSGRMGEMAESSPEHQERIKKQLRSYIIRRFGRPEDVAAMATFLASPLAEWITGQTYPVNGGYTVNQ
jgi:NAD(P)-dependent dehydrogenase (short-subunit alcohol dehydrogenase family)